MSVTVLIPAHDEAARIGASVGAALGIPGVGRVLVIDDASGDATADLAETAGAEVLRLPSNLGKGAALDAGLARVRASADILLMLDGDLGSSAAEGALLLEPVLSGEAAMAVAAFPRPAGKAGFGLVKGLARFGIRALGGTAGRSFAATAPLSGQRAMTRECWEKVTPFAFGYGVEVALTVRALRSGLRVVEVPTTMAHDATGRDASGFAHRGRQFVHVARALLRLAVEPRR
ncbi:MAG TPA: glycosyltransferase family 2 protein [Coriobacteriia bacterium]